MGSGSSIIVLGLVALSPMAVADARNVRMYALEAMFTTLAWWFIWRLLHHQEPGSQRIRDQVLAAAFVAGELWSLAFGLPVAGLQGMAAGLFWIHGRADPSARRRALSAMASIVAGTVLFVPWLPALLGSATSSTSFWTGPPARAAVLETFAAMLVGTSPLPVAVVGATLLLALLAMGLERLLRGRHPALQADDARLLGAVLVMGVAIVPIIWGGSYVRSVYDQRYFGAAVAPAAMAIAAGWTALQPGLDGGGSRRWALRAGGLVAAGCVLAGSVVSIADSVSGRGLAPSSAVMAFLESHVRLGDSVIAVDARSYFPLAYLAGRARAPDPLPVPIWYWHSPGEPTYDGGSLVSPDDTLANSLVYDPSWPWVIPGLKPGGHVWIVALANGGNDQIAFAPLHRPGLRETERILIQRGTEIAQVRRLDPTGMQ